MPLAVAQKDTWTKVHERSCSADSSLGDSRKQDAAARWGFWHLGQFSRDYKGQFGELPSQTLKAAEALR
jgi:AraC-like DNA-binding protein